MRWRTAHNRRRAWRDKQPVCCPVHGRPFRGDGWSGWTALFRCPVLACRQRRFIKYPTGSVTGIWRDEAGHIQALPAPIVGLEIGPMLERAIADMNALGTGILHITADGVAHVTPETFRRETESGAGDEPDAAA